MRIETTFAASIYTKYAMRLNFKFPHSRDLNIDRPLATTCFKLPMASERASIVPALSTSLVCHLFMIS